MPSGFQAFGSAEGYVGTKPPFTPPSISGLQLWLRADLGVTLVSSKVSAWADQSGTGDANKNVSQGNALLRPTLNAANASYGNKPTVHWTGSLGGLHSTAWVAPLAQPYTLIVIGNFDGTSASQAFIDDDSGANRVILGNALAGGNFFELFAGTDLDDGVTRTATPKVYIGVANGGSSKTYVSSTTATATGAAGARTFTGTTIGASFADTAALVGDIAEVIVYSHALTTPEIQSILDYSLARYGF